MTAGSCVLFTHLKFLQQPFNHISGAHLKWNPMHLISLLPIRWQPDNLQHRHFLLGSLQLGPSAQKVSTQS